MSVHTTRFWKTFTNRKIGKPKYLKVSVSNKTKGSKQNSQNPLRSPMSEGGEP
jgi:hypothetical protein